MELVLDREAATELVRLLIPLVGRTEVGLMVDTKTGGVRPTTRLKT